MSMTATNRQLGRDQLEQALDAAVKRATGNLTPATLYRPVQFSQAGLFIRRGCKSKNGDRC